MSPNRSITRSVLASLVAGLPAMGFAATFYVATDGSDVSGDGSLAFTARNIVIEGNLFFNQSGSDEHIDINSVIGVTIQDNIFLNTSEPTDTSSFVVIKDSNGNNDTVLSSNNITVRPNIFLKP